MKLRNENNESKRSERLQRLEALFLEADSGQGYSGGESSGEERASARGRILLEAARLALRSEAAKSKIYALEALSCARAASDDELEMEIGVVLANVRASALRSLADCYARISLFTSALDYASQAQRLAEEAGDDGERALAWKISGDAYSGLGEPRKALQHYREALRIAEERDKAATENARTLESASNVSIAPPSESDAAFRAEERGDILLSMGAGYARLKGFSEARLYYERAFAAYREAGEERGLTKSLLGVADILLAQSRYEQALELLFAALDYTAEQPSAETERAQTYCALARTYLRAERPRKALEYALWKPSAASMIKPLPISGAPRRSAIR